MTHEYLVYTRRKLNVYKTFRRRLGRLLNVLCTFNLRPVSTGYICIMVLVMVMQRDGDDVHVSLDDGNYMCHELS